MLKLFNVMMQVCDKVWSTIWHGFDVGAEQRTSTEGFDDLFLVDESGAVSQDGQFQSCELTAPSPTEHVKHTGPGWWQND